MLLTKKNSKSGNNTTHIGIEGAKWVCKTIIFGSAFILSTLWTPAKADQSIHLSQDVNQLNAQESESALRKELSPEFLDSINKKWNNLRQADDREIYGVEDYWGTPEETMAKHAGDCEDLAIGKYFDLRAAGVADENVFLAHVNLKGYGPHMVVLIQKGKNTFVLDNITNEIETLIDRPELHLIYKINHSEMTINLFGGRTTPASKNAKWTNLLARMSNA